MTTRHRPPIRSLASAAAFTAALAPLSLLPR